MAPGTAFRYAALIYKTNGIHMFVMKVSRPISEARIGNGDATTVICIIFMAYEAEFRAQGPHVRRVVAGGKDRPVRGAMGPDGSGFVIPVTIGAVHGLGAARPGCNVGPLRVDIRPGHGMIGRVCRIEFQGLIRHIASQ